MNRKMSGWITSNSISTHCTYHQAWLSGCSAVFSAADRAGKFILPHSAHLKPQHLWLTFTFVWLRPQLFFFMSLSLSATILWCSCTLLFQVPQITWVTVFTAAASSSAKYGVQPQKSGLLLPEVTHTTSRQQMTAAPGERKVSIATVWCWNS